MATKLGHVPLHLILICLLLAALNFYIIDAFSIETSRLIRVITTAFLLVVFLSLGGYKSIVAFLTLATFLTRDIFILGYEIPLNKTVSFILTICAYLVLSGMTLKRINFSKTTPTIIVFIFGLIALNVFNVYYLSDVVTSGLDNSLQLGLFFLQGAVIILLSFTGFIYNDRYQGKMPLIYLYCVL